MSEPLKVGDRVRVYATNNRKLLETNGTIEKIGGDGTVYVAFLKGSEIGNWACWAHQKQCRRLVKRSPLRVWVEIGDTNHAPRVYLEKPKGIATVECVQVKR